MDGCNTDRAVELGKEEIGNFALRSVQDPNFGIPVRELPGVVS